MDIPARARLSPSPSGSEMFVPRTGTNILMAISKAIKHRKPVTDYVSIKWEKDSKIKDYVHRKDPVNCGQCRLGIHGKDKHIGDIVLRNSQYQKEDTKINPSLPSTKHQAAALTIPPPQYLTIDKPQKFFTRGRIFKTVWFEPFGEHPGSFHAHPSELIYHESCPEYLGPLCSKPA